MQLVSTFILFIIASTDAFIPSDMNEYINTKFRPCADFYSYACGDWRKEYQLKESETHVSLSTSTIDSHIDHIVQEMINMKTPIIHEFWESCSDLMRITQQGNMPLRSDVFRIYHTNTITQLMELAGEFARTGGSVFVKFKVGPNPLKTNINTLLLEPEVTLPYSRYYFDEFIRNRYENYIHDIMESVDNEREDFSTLNDVLGKRKRDSDSLDAISNVVIKIEQQLTHLRTQMDKSTFPIKIEDAIRSWPNVFMSYTSGMDLLKYKNGKRILTYNSYIQQDLTIWGSIEYLNQIETMLQNLTIKELQTYIAFRMIHSRSLWLGRTYNAAWYNFFRQTLKGQRKHVPRDRVCRDRLRKHLPDLIGEYFYTKSFDSQRGTKAFEIVKFIRVAMWEHINKAKWLDDKTDPYLESLRKIMGESSSHSSGWNEKSEKHKAIEKLNQLTFLVGQSKIQRSYPSTLTSDDYPANMYKIMSHSFDEAIKKVGQAVNPDEWTESSIEINAHYIPNRNAIVLPTGVLQPPLLHGANVHPARGFGALGSMIGHELIHAFDAKGSLYDAQGNEFPWWDSEKSEYTEPAKCFENQYSAFVVDGRRVNGKITLNEIIADNGGVSLAWNAYRKYITTVKTDTYGVSPREGEKLFFIAFAQSLCERSRGKIVYGNPDKFLPSKARVNGVVMNNKNFAAAFQCKSNAGMNAKVKCVLW